MTSTAAAPLTPLTPGAPDAHAAPAAGRLAVLDVLRGVALCGIVWLNVPTITGFTFGPTFMVNFAPWLEPLFRGRFIGLFAALFGVSFALVLASAALRHPWPRLVLARRFAFLLLIGLAHHLLQPGEVLTQYAVLGLVVLLPLSYLAWRWVPLLLGVLALVAAAALQLEPGYNSVGMMLLGFGAARFALPERLERPNRSVVLVVAGLVPVYAVALFLQQSVSAPMVNGASAAYTWADFLAGVLGALCYGGVVVLLVQTRARRALRAVFEPLGRMALTNYLGATLLAVAAQLLLGSGWARSTGPDLLLSAAILAVQVPLSRWWLARFRYGPVEWLWRVVTWWQPVAIRKDTPV